jgi:hypothetical protein
MRITFIFFFFLFLSLSDTLLANRIYANGNLLLFFLVLAKNPHSDSCKLMVGLLGNLPFEAMRCFNEDIHFAETLTI